MVIQDSSFSHTIETLTVWSLVVMMGFGTILGMIDLAKSFIGL